MKLKLTLVFLLFCALSLTTTAQVKIGGKKINVGKAVKAATETAKAITLSDADIAKICSEYMEWMDAHNPLTAPDTEYGKRLEKMVGHITEVEGMKVNFGVYEVVDVNAFACGDGSIRICAGLMDVMTDEEVMAVIGHEIGHIVNTDVKDAMKNAYLRSAAVNAAGAFSDTAAKLGDSELGQLADALAGAQFSQKQENAADDYALKFCVQNEIDPYAMSNSLNKLVEMFNSGGEKSSKIQQMFSTHPDSEKRAKRMKEKADQYVANK
ncbi:M48 family metallopeptidase [Bacteroides sp. 519]|uniref:M48 family metallopeptidase n=1 Tax=Bacteroides sp. 519 TaxID=2302937 RepID=UPI0013D2DF6C|nr:M48 family metallopeptidase [Bacteroides sp. 519]NDV58375.1 peptidase M48 [Bacteroides sp. 519]